jgi:hypothetical protein
MVYHVSGLALQIFFWLSHSFQIIYTNSLSFCDSLGTYGSLNLLSFAMKYSILIKTFVLARLSIAGYVIQDDYNPSNFVGSFKAFSGADPTDGFGMTSHDRSNHT